MTRPHRPAPCPTDPRRRRPGRRAPLAATLLCLLGPALSGCAPGDMNDLESYSREVLARPGGRVEPLPEFEPYQRYLYESAETGARDPFQSFFQRAPEAISTPAVDPRQQAFLQEMRSRNREELENYELDSLRMVGTLTDQEELWAIVADRSGTIHRVRKGNYMGRNYGKILAITEDSIELREIIEDGLGGFEERDASIALTEQ